MNPFVSVVALAAALAFPPVHAQDTATTKPTPIRSAPDARKAVAAPPAAAPTLASLTPQNRMKECNKAATGKKGAERKTFMKTCLSSKP